MIPLDRDAACVLVMALGSSVLFGAGMSMADRPGMAWILAFIGAALVGFPGLVLLRAAQRRRREGDVLLRRDWPPPE